MLFDILTDTLFEPLVFTMSFLNLLNYWPVMLKVLLVLITPYELFCVLRSPLGFRSIVSPQVTHSLTLDKGRRLLKILTKL